MKKIALIGSTGSIGKQVLNVVRNNPDKFSVASLAAGNNLTLFTEQVKEFKPPVATAIKRPEENLPDGTEYFLPIINTLTIFSMFFAFTFCKNPLIFIRELIELIAAEHRSVFTDVF